MTGYRIIERNAFSRIAEDPFEADVSAGLSRVIKSIPSKYFYDDEGSRLFSRITDLPEYYLTRCELDVLRERGGDIADLIGGEPYNLVELGAGDGTKTGVLLDALVAKQHRLRYVPIDISEGAMRELVERLGPLADSGERLDIAGLVCEYIEGLRLLKSEERRNVVLFLGSNIGNFTAKAAGDFLRRLRMALNPGDLALIGFDLKKEVSLLRQAYSDSEGITAQFNLNLLTRINRELGADFDLRKFRHYAAYNFRTGAMESFLASTQRQAVRIDALDRTFYFQEWEAIQTECSAKYTEAQIAGMAESAGFEVVADFFDGQHYFCDSLWRVKTN